MIEGRYSKGVVIKEDGLSVNKVEEERNGVVEVLGKNGYYLYGGELISLMGERLIGGGYVKLRVVEKDNIGEEGLGS